MENKKQQTSKTTKKLFWGILTPTIIITLALCAAFGVLSLSILNYYVRARTSLQIEETSSGIYELLAPALADMELISGLSSTDQNPKTLRTLLEAAAGKDKAVQAFYWGTAATMTDPDGYFVLSDGWTPPNKDWTQVTQPWFIGAVKAHGKVFTLAYQNPRTNAYCLSFSRAVYNEKGSLAGVCGFDLDLGVLSDAIGVINESSYAPYYIISADGTFLTHPDKSKIMTANYFDGPGAGLSAEDTLTENAFAFVDWQDYRAYGKIGDTTLYVITSGKTDSYSRIVKIVIIFLAIVGIILCIGTAVFNFVSAVNEKKEIQFLANSIFTETQKFVDALKKNVSVTQSQSSTAKKVAENMDSANTLSKNISEKIKDVSDSAKTSAAVAEQGSETFAQTLDRLEGILDESQKSAGELTALGDKLENTDTVLALINKIAEQAKIVAFNTDLEASNAGAAEKSFRVVADEVRRLSDGSLAAIGKIKAKITEIRTSADALKEAGASETEKTTSGYEAAKELSQHFEALKSTVDATNARTDEVSKLIHQQAAASQQLVAAVKQISSGVEEFSAVTDNISEYSENIKKMIESLNEVVQK